MRMRGVDRRTRIRKTEKGQIIQIDYGKRIKKGKGYNLIVGSSSETKHQRITRMAKMTYR